MESANNSSKCVFVMDIGSNSIRLMRADILPDGKFLPGNKQLATTRLAQDLDVAGTLQPASIDRSIAAMRDFCAAAGDAPVYAYATSAVRDAKNRQDFLDLVLRECGLAVEVLSGEQEAEYAFLGAVGTERGALIDIGGGSAQVVTAERGYSFPIGCVRTKDRFSALPYREARAQIAGWAGAYLENCSLQAECWTGVGGTITTLAALVLNLEQFDEQTVSGTMLSRPALEDLLTRLEAMGERRKEHPLLTKRHDVILYGGAVLAVLMDRFGVDAVRASCSDGMEGYLRIRLGA